MRQNLNLAWNFFLSANQYSSRPCIFAHDREYTYKQVLHRVGSIANWLSDSGNSSPRHIGILGTRSFEACCGILASAWTGAAYIPLNLSQTADALTRLLKWLDLDAIIVDHAGAEKLTPDVIPDLPPKVLIPDSATAERNNWRKFLSLQQECNFEPRAVAGDGPGYIEFTSGSTGTPKGVVIPNKAVSHFLRIMQERYAIQPEDRIAETADTSFDISVFNMFMTWRTGASLHIVPKKQAIAPLKFIQEQKITVWFSVPSVAVAMSRMGMLKPGALPTLRVSLFSGEPLPSKAALAWGEAACNSVVDNLYGPTEATVICLCERVGETPNVTAERDVISIGTPLEGTEASIWDTSRRPLPANTPGELVLGGQQLALGYLGDAEKTAARFVEQNRKRWYLTGDLAYQDEQGRFHHLGRIDNQIKIRGYRVELEEVETHLRHAYRTSSAAAVAWPVEYGMASGIVAFVTEPGRTGDEATEELRLHMPLYMFPSKVHVLADLPSNSSGKIDRKALTQKLAEGEF
jgi:D-alanine--poly(phosphoribitol) ligase subunit 1